MMKSSFFVKLGELFPNIVSRGMSRVTRRCGPLPVAVGHEDLQGIPEPKNVVILVVTVIIARGPYSRYPKQISTSPGLEGKKHLQNSQVFATFLSRSSVTVEVPEQVGLERNFNQLPCFQGLYPILASGMIVKSCFFLQGKKSMAQLLVRDCKTIQDL